MLETGLGSYSGRPCHLLNGPRFPTLALFILAVVKTFRRTIARRERKALIQWYTVIFVWGACSEGLCVSVCVEGAFFLFLKYFLKGFTQVPSVLHSRPDISTTTYWVIFRHCCNFPTSFLEMKLRCEETLLSSFKMFLLYVNCFHF